jgi:hypothetical protein
VICCNGVCNARILSIAAVPSIPSSPLANEDDPKLSGVHHPETVVTASSQVDSSSSEFDMRGSEQQVGICQKMSCLQS